MPVGGLAFQRLVDFLIELIGVRNLMVDQLMSSSYCPRGGFYAMEVLRCFMRGDDNVVHTSLVVDNQRGNENLIHGLVFHKSMQEVMCIGCFMYEE